MTLQLRVGGLYQRADGMQVRITSVTHSNICHRDTYAGNVLRSDGSEEGSPYHWFEDGDCINYRFKYNLIAEVREHKADFVASLIGGGLISPNDAKRLLNYTHEDGPSCQHEWKETQGFSRMYKDCLWCKAKWEDVK